MSRYHVLRLDNGRPILHSTHPDRQHATGEYSRVGKASDAALVRVKGGELDVLSATVPFLQSDRKFMRAAERAVAAPAATA